MTQNQDNVLTIEELAVYLKISKSTLYKLAQAGEVPGQKGVAQKNRKYHGRP